MRVRVLGGGFYGCSLAASLLERGYNVDLFEIRDRLFGGASGNIPARLHAGALHYPRSHATRKACLAHRDEFMQRFGFLTRGVATNIYAVAEYESLIDFGTYLEVVKRDLECITIYDPAEYGLRHVEGAILTAERHILTDRAREHFTALLAPYVQFNTPPGLVDDPRWDMTIDATFCANEGAGIDRFEPCVTALLEGPVGKSITIVDGAFGSLYQWDPDRQLSSLSSAKWTPFSKSIKSWGQAAAVLDQSSRFDVDLRVNSMIDQMRHYYPAIEEYRYVEPMLSIRAMPLSGADTRLVDVVRVGDRAVRVRAGKIDAVLDAERQVMELIACM